MIKDRTDHHLLTGSFLDWSELVYVSHAPAAVPLKPTFEVTQAAQVSAGHPSGKKTMS